MGAGARMLWDSGTWGQTRTSVISRPPLATLCPASGSGRTEYEGRIGSPKTYFHAWKGELSAGSSVEYIAVVKLSAYCTWPHIYCVRVSSEEHILKHIPGNCARWSVLSGTWGPVYSRWIVNKSQGLGDRELITVIACILNAGYEVRRVVIELQDVYVSSTFWFPKCFIYVTDNFQWLSEFRPF